MSFKNKNIVRSFPFFTHFCCIPLIEKQYQIIIEEIQKSIENKLKIKGFDVQQNLKRHNHLLSHITMLMLTLKRDDVKNKIIQILQKQKQEIKSKLQGLQITPGQVKYFTRFNKNQKCQQITVIYLQIDQKSTKTLNQFVDYLVRTLLHNQIISNEQLKSMRIIYDHKLGKFYPQTFHISLFRCRDLIQRQKFLQAYNQVKYELNQRRQKKLIKFNCHLLDISTMMEFDMDQFYLPLKRIELGVLDQKQQEEKLLNTLTD